MEQPKTATVTIEGVNHADAAKPAGSTAPKSTVTADSFVESKPSAAIIGKRIASGEDARGRKFEIKKIGPLERLKLYELLGPELSENTMYLGNMMTLFALTAFDGEKMPVTGTRKQDLEQLAAKLDDDGVDAVNRLYRETFSTGETADARTVKN